MFARQIYPGADAARGRPGSAVPVHLGTVAQPRRARPRSGVRRGALRARQGARGPRTASSRSATRGLLVPLESVISHFLPWLFPEMEIVERARFRLTRDGDTEISDDADDLLEAVETELRKRRFGAVVRLEVSSSISRDDARAARGTARRQRRQRLSDPRAARPRRRRPALRARPPRPEVRAVGAVHAAPARRVRPTTTCSPRSRSATSSSSIRTTRSRRASRRSSAQPRRIRSVVDAEDDRLPHEPRLGASRRR